MRFIHTLILTILITSITSAAHAVEDPGPFSVGWEISSASGSLAGVHFAGPETGWAVGNGGTILATRDGGATWTAQASGTTEDLWGVHFAGPETGWAVGDGGTILATRDGGATWTAQASGTTEYLGGVHFAGPETGAIVGSRGIILRSTAPNYAPAIASNFEHHLDGELGLVLRLEDKEGDDASLVSPACGFGRTRTKATGVRSSPIRQETRAESGASPGTRAKPDMVSELEVRCISRRRSTTVDRRWRSKCWKRALPTSPGGSSCGEATALQSSLWVAFWEQFSFMRAAFRYYYGLRPVSLARLGGSSALDEIGDGIGRQNWLHALVRVGTRVFFNPWITTRPRVRRAWITAYQQRTQLFADLGATVRPSFLAQTDVLDAWVERRTDQARGALEHFELFRRRKLYVSLPVRMGDPETGQLVDQPSPMAFRHLFDRERVVLPIVGVGGSGKSTLACALARWALFGESENRLAPWRMLPVFVAEETDNLFASITQNLGAMVGGDELDKDIVEALLRHKRLLVIVDALSERSPATQRHVAEIFRSGIPFNSLAVTARREPEFGPVDRTSIYPERISGRRLIPFIYEYLRRRNLAEEFDEREQLRLGDRVFALVEAGGRALNITPLLVTLFVESALEKSRGRGRLDELPTSVPEVFLDYLRRLNPKDAETPDAFDDPTVIKAARVLGSTCVGESFVPGDIRRDEAEAALTEAGFGQNASRLVQRLVGNGIIEEWEVAGTSLLRFALDPVAEHLAAIDTVHHCGSDPRAWGEAFARLQRTQGYPEQINGFLMALGDCYVTYRRPLNLPDLELPWIQETAKEAA